MKDELNQKKTFQTVRRKFYKTLPLYKKVDYYNLISSFREIVQVKASKDLFKVKVAGEVVTPAENKFFYLLERHFCILVIFFLF